LPLARLADPVEMTAQFDGGRGLQHDCRHDVARLEEHAVDPRKLPRWKSAPAVRRRRGDDLSRPPSTAPVGQLQCAGVCRASPRSSAWRDLLRRRCRFAIFGVGVAGRRPQPARRPPGRRRSAWRSVRPRFEVLPGSGTHAGAVRPRGAGLGRPGREFGMAEINL